ncbi:MAG: helix-hairpin-helix domain-containing protein [Phycisphaerales bacterium]|jgi:competence protein ComEA
MEERATGHNPGLEGAQSLGFLVASFAGLILALAFAAGTVHRDAGSPELRPGGQINPNEASLESLARLPGIGLARARAIITLRERLQDGDGHEPVFRNADDLAQVKGIGPATVNGMRAWLRFDASPGGADESAAR